MKYRRFWRDHWAARERVLDDHWILPTRCGPMEYVTHGAGTSVLVLHGAIGGTDQGIASARGLAIQGFRLIAPSSFGRLRSRGPEDPLPVAYQPEADTWACFLDALRIDRAPVLAFAEGSASAIRFARRHPDRVSALVLMVAHAAARGPGSAVVAGDAMLDADGWAGVPLWMLMRMVPRGMYALVAAAISLVTSFPPQDRARGGETIRSVFPAGQSPLGLQTPTLLISAEDDLYRNLPAVPHALPLTAGTGSLTYDAGRHLLLAPGREVWPSAGGFIRRAQTTRP